LNREEERQEFCGNNNDDDDIKSISSESSGEGIPVGFSMKSQSNDECILYDPNELEASLRALPTADKVEEIVKNNNQTYEFQGIVELSVAMLFAVWYRNLEFTASLLKQQANVNMIDGKGRTALHYACITGNGPMTRLLLHFKSKIDSWDHQYTITPLHCAALSGSFDCLLLLLKNGAQPNAGIEKKSALHYAVQKNAVKCVQCLLQFGSNPNPPQILVETPIHIASEMGYVDCLKALIDAGADVSVPAGNKKNTALHLAAEDDTVECAKILIEAGANINARNGDDQTPLHVACLAHSVETVELLIRNGADIHATYRDGRTALHASIVKETSSWDCAKILLDHKVDVNRADNFGYTPLHLAALNEFSSCAYMLIEYGADIIARTNGGVTALSFIVRRTPELIPKYLAKFDTSIRVNEHEIGDVDCEIRLDFRCLVSNYERGETELLLAFIEVGQKRILKHPLAETFLFLKWRRIRKYFLFSIFYHALYVMLFTIYSMGVFVNHCNDECHPSDTYVSIMMIIDYILLFLNVMLVGKEIFQGMHGFYLYVKNWENWLQWSIIIGVFLCAVSMNLMI
jgi:ankyrin repeat protein